MSAERPADDAKTLRAAQRAERLGRLRATAVCTVIDNPAPRGLPPDKPAIVAGGAPCLEEIVADMALPLAEVPRAPLPAARRPTADKGITAFPRAAASKAAPPSAGSVTPAAPPAGPAGDLMAHTPPWSQRPLAPPPLGGRGGATGESAPVVPSAPSAAPPSGAPQPAAPPSAARMFRLDPPELSPRVPIAMPTFTLAKDQSAAKAAEDAAKAGEGAKPPVATKSEPSPYPVGELYRQMRQNVLGQVPAGHAAMVWICPTGSEPLSDHLVELASAFAEGCDGEILLVDANFQSAALTRRFNLGEKSGLAEVLAKKLPPQGAGHETAVARVRVLPKGGDAVGRASRRANEEEWKSLLAGLKERYRYVLIDAPGVEEPHCLPLAKAADAAFVAIALDHTPRETVQEALEHLHLHKAHVAGCVITDAPV